METRFVLLAEHNQGEVEEATLEVLGEARRLADEAGTGVRALLLGHGVDRLAEPLGRSGADRVSLVDHPLLEHYSTDGYGQALTHLLGEEPPEFLLMAATGQGRDLAARMAVRLDAGLVSDCTAVQLDREGRLEVRRPAYGGRIWATYSCVSPRPVILTVRPGVLGVAAPRKGRTYRTERVEVPLNANRIRTRVLRCTREESHLLDVSEAEAVVAFGRGIGHPGFVPQVRELAGLLDATWGGTRAGVDEGWLPYPRQIGQTGKTVKPHLLVCLGISGAPQFTLGIREARCIVALNKDRHAPIFQVADVAVVGDIHEILPPLIERLKSLARSHGTAAGANR